MTKVSVTNRSNNKKPPFTEQKILDIISNIDTKSPNELITKLSENLGNLTSKYKLIIQYTNISGNKDTADLNINTGFTANWDSSKDGCFTVSINLNDPNVEKGEEQGTNSEQEPDINNENHHKKVDSLLVTIYWISE
ncbi:uncharacterized protein KGF55_001770 [Candida pseudojiufengensis]|uniref:uncharacterized protein n=1 Tax=Candida pseudojiufengensis TaxID=497109 RepID=UPI0022242FFC|nr:uncharacterized protein KGF55_001770 [Candida pseudojiufengensis]KAI5964701.1 hypothetical protein KGF55_001770 [Candida pseudojiufengensis]